MFSLDPLDPLDPLGSLNTLGTLRTDRSRVALAGSQDNSHGHHDYCSHDFHPFLEGYLTD
ncbi:MAG: hypothetical protein OXH02_10275 [Gemmatimonadetes bacterium]|nr:hypothetical protein [Gemmatimonadota bacterium]